MSLCGGQGCKLESAPGRQPCVAGVAEARSHDDDFAVVGLPRPLGGVVASAMLRLRGGVRAQQAFAPRGAGVPRRFKTNATALSRATHTIAASFAVIAE